MAMRALNSFRTVSQLCRGNLDGERRPRGLVGARGAAHGPAPEALRGRGPGLSAWPWSCCLGRCRVDGVAPRAAPASPLCSGSQSSALGSAVLHSSTSHRRLECTGASSNGKEASAGLFSSVLQAASL